MRNVRRDEAVKAGHAIERIVVALLAAKGFGRRGGCKREALRPM
jgi:hypothetical protein